MITGKICGIRVEEIEEPLMQEIRYLDKLVDELARGKTLEKILNRLKIEGEIYMLVNTEKIHEECRSIWSLQPKQTRCCKNSLLWTLCITT